MFYSAQTSGFYDPALHGNNIPADAVEITAEQHAALLEGQSSGKRIVADAAGRPVLQDPPPPTAAEIAASVTAARVAAYRDESDPLFFKAQRGEGTMQEWLAKVEEIKARYPRPAA
jgi:hypothetical protein